MSEARFIEGPWQLGGVVKLDGRTGDYQRITDGGGMGANIIAHVCVAHPANFELAESGRANAHLIAAAPDLYDAAENALNALIGCCVPAGGVDDRKTILEAQAMLRAAIAKALGR